MAAKYVIHNYPSQLDLPLDDKWFHIPPAEPFEIDRDSNGRVLDTPEFYTHHLLSIYGPIYGLVEIPAIKTRTGITLDVDRAMEQADAALLLNRHRHVNLWASEQLQTRVSKNLPVLPPTGFVEESIKLLGIDLAATYNIRPVGWSFHPAPGTSKADATLLAAASDTTGEEVVALRAQNDELSRRLNSLEGMLQQLVATKEKQAQSSKPSITPKGQAQQPKGE